MNKTETKKLSDIISKPEISFDSIFGNTINILEFNIDCSKLEKPNYNIKSLSYATTILPMIHELMKIEEPCIYWFKGEDELVGQKFLADLNSFREKKTGRNLPAKNNYRRNSNCLYLGIRQGGTRKKDGFSFIAGRISTHLGYYHVPTTQGLNLAYWAKDIITLKVMVLPKEASIYLNVLEKLYAKQLKPLCGKH